MTGEASIQGLMSFLTSYTGVGLTVGVVSLPILMIHAGGPDGMTADWIAETAPKVAVAMLKASVTFTATCWAVRFSFPDTGWQRLRKQLPDLGLGGVVEGGLVMIWVGTVGGVVAIVLALATAWMWGPT